MATGHPPLAARERVAQVIVWKGTRWLWLLGAIGWFAGGLFASEVGCGR